MNIHSYIYHPLYNMLTVIYHFSQFCSGYMSPEYAMFGQFSEKLDVYSFGVMVLEIISGKKNIGSYEPHRIVNCLLKFVSTISFCHIFILLSFMLDV